MTLVLLQPMAQRARHQQELLIINSNAHRHLLLNSRSA